MLSELCRALRRAGDATALVEAAARCLELARLADDPQAQLRARLQMGHGWFLQGQIARAEEVLTEAVREAADLGQVAVEQSARQELVRALLQRGKVQEAREEARQLAGSELWWPRWSGHLLLAAIAIQSADLGEASQHLADAEEVITGGNEPPARRALAMTYLQSNRTNLALVAGDFVTAREYNESLCVQAAQASAADQLREAEVNRALLSLRSGDLGDASDRLRLLQEWAGLTGDARLGALVMVLRSELHRRLGDIEQALADALAALDSAAALGHVQAIAEAEHARSARSRGGQEQRMVAAGPSARDRLAGVDHLEG